MSQTLRISAGDYNITTASNANVIFSTGNVTINGNLTVANISYINQETITSSDVIQGNLTANALTVNNSATIGSTLGVTGNVLLGGNLGVNGGTVTVYDSIVDLHTYGNLLKKTLFISTSNKSHSDPEKSMRLASDMTFSAS